MELSITMPRSTKSKKVKRAVKFSKWLKRHIERDDPVGDLARDLYDRGPRQRVPLEASDDVYTFLDALKEADACDGALVAALSAWAEYVRAFPSRKKPIYCEFCRKEMTRSDSEFWFRHPWDWASGFSHSRCVNEKIRAEYEGDETFSNPEGLHVNLAYAWRFGGQREHLLGTLTRIRLSDPLFLDKIADLKLAIIAHFRKEASTVSAHTQNFAEEKVREVFTFLDLSQILHQPIVPSEDSEEPPAESSVYFIRQGDDGPIKIGFTASNPEKRKQQLQTSIADTLHTLLVLPGTRATESHYHARFADLRLRGEWFRPDPVLLDFIQQARSEGRDVWS